MRLGINFTPKHRTPEEWGDILVAEGFSAASFPTDYRAKQSLIDAYVKAAQERDIRIAEVGIWDSPFSPDREKAKKAREKCLEQFRLAEYIHADCCVNVSGAAGPVWCGCYRENFSEELYGKNVEFIQELCDRVKPEHTCFALEPMQWMVPDSPEQYVKILRDVDREGFAVHMDIVNFIKDPYTYTHQEELIRRTFALLGDRIASCHLKDCTMEEGLTVKIREVLPGTGNADIPVYLEEIKRLDKDMPVLLEHLPELEQYRSAAEYVRQLL